MSETNTRDLSVEPSAPAVAPAPSNEAAQSSPAPGREATPAPSAPAGTEAESRDDLLSVVEKAVEDAFDPRGPDEAAARRDDRSEAGAASPAAQVGQDATAGQAEADLPEITPQELDSFKPETRKRIKQLISQRDQARVDVSRYRGDAEQHGKVQQFMREHDLSAEETARGFIAMAAVKRGDARQFLQEVGPLINWAQQALGMRLPDDLENRVREGRVDRDTAAELARTRHDAAAAQFTAQRETQARQSNAETVSRERQVGDVKSAVQSWEREKRGSDVDFPHVEHALKRTVQALIGQHGPPPDGEAARALVEAAYAEAKQMLRRQGSPREIRTGPTGASSATTRTTREPETMEDAIRIGLERARG